MSNIKLKEIKPGMVIHCKDDEEKKVLLKEAEKLGYVWYSDMAKPTEKLHVGNTIHFHDGSEIIFSAQYKNITHSDLISNGVIEFSDLIIPDMSVEEVLSILAEIKNKCGKEFETCHKCPLDRINAGSNGYLCDLENMVDTDKVIRICQKWKADHEKKEPEVEWVFKGVADIVGCNEIDFFDTEEKAKEWCERRTVETGNSHAYAPVCRVKSVN